MKTCNILVYSTCGRDNWRKKHGLANKIVMSLPKYPLCQVRTQPNLCLSFGGVWLAVEMEVAYIYNYTLCTYVLYVHVLSNKYFNPKPSRSNAPSLQVWQIRYWYVKWIFRTTCGPFFALLLFPTTSLNRPGRDGWKYTFTKPNPLMVGGDSTNLHRTHMYAHVIDCMSIAMLNESRWRLLICRPQTHTTVHDIRHTPDSNDHNTGNQIDRNTDIDTTYIWIEESINTAEESCTKKASTDTGKYRQAQVPHS